MARERDIKPDVIADAVKRSPRKVSAQRIAKDVAPKHGAAGNDKNFAPLVGRHLSENRRELGLKRTGTTRAKGSTYDKGSPMKNEAKRQAKTTASSVMVGLFKVAGDAIVRSAARRGSGKR